MKSKIPKKFKKYDKMSDTDFEKWLKRTYNYTCTFESNGVITVWNYFGKDVITCDSKSMIAYWLAIFKK